MGHTYYKDAAFYIVACCSLIFEKKERESSVLIFKKNLKVQMIVVRA